MKKTLILTLNLLVAAHGAFAQTDTLFIETDTLAVYHDEPVPEYIDEDDYSDFPQGTGAGVDTLDIGDGRLNVVLKDDHTWYYIKNFDVIARDSTFVMNWVPNSLNPYTFPLDSLPFRCSIMLIDSASSFVCPHVRAVFSKFGYRKGRRHQGVDLPLQREIPSMWLLTAGCVPRYTQRDMATS